jgi:hypothetical protein
VILSRCAIFRPATAEFRIIIAVLLSKQATAATVLKSGEQLPFFQRSLTPGLTNPL